MLVERSVAAESVRDLADLFEHAKFSPHPVDEAMRADALRLVAEVRDQLVAEADGVVPPEREVVA